ncbi:hypothetical protein J2848_005702 [Azospirillum lipoferum]|uniref:Uncharacterized protein n=1 Tax=Azospirillum lipoferum TaxID=193 RepID=A0A5A9GGU0_AZOLI|nr:MULTISPECIES: hypothetical protein [Azospirillum]KAA0592942.1 hypothetical protein FZ942_25805 [Azospirillum lipoferum]MCP1614001.1 hypothetical protein [Azospirillum lipoferum]MDW5537607.1 hypothetical protein [Azospirillum sp. NL1]
MPYLMRVEPYDASLGAVRPLFFSDIGFTSEPGDAPSNTYFVRRIETPLQVRRSLFDGSAVGGFSETSFGSATLANDDGGLDWLADLDWDGRLVEILYTPKERPALSDFAVLFSGAAEQLVPGDLIEIQLRDLVVLLDVPASRGQFGGTGGIDGTAELKGRYKPWLIGRRRQIEPVLIDAANNVYMVDPAGFSSLLATRDKGVAYPAAVGDYASYDALVAASLTGTDVATSKAAGLIRLGQAPAGRFTIDAEGVKVSGGWIYRFADLVRHLVTSMTTVTGASLLDASFTTFNTLQPAVLGYWCDGSSVPKVRDVIDQIADSVGAYWGFGEDRLLSLGRYDGPAATADFAFGERDIIDLTPRSVDRRMKSLKLGYRPFGVTFTASDLDQVNVTAADVEAFQTEYRWTAVAADAAAAAASLLATEDEGKTLFDVEADAIAERNRRLALHAAKRKAFDVTVPLTTGLTVGHTVALTDPRYGLAAGWNGLVLELERDADEETMKLTVLG